MSWPGNTLPADLDVDQLFEASRALDEARAELREARELTSLLAGAAPTLDRLEHAAELLDRIQARHAALGDAITDLEQARSQVAQTQLELQAAAWPPEPDARPMLARLQATMPKLDRIDQLIEMLDRAEVIKWPPR